MKLSEEQVMVAKGMQERGVSMRQLADQLGVTEGAVRYRLKRLAEGPRPDGRCGQPTALDGYEAVVEAIQRALGDGRLTGGGRPCQARQIYEVLVRDHGYGGSYQAVVRHLRRKHGAPKLRALRRVETPPGVQAQHDWFEVRVAVGSRQMRLQALLGTLSHSRARFCWVSEDQSQLAWHTGHLALFRRYGGVPLWVRIDNLKTGVARGAGPTAVLNRAYRVFARTCGFEIDPCRPAKGSDKGKAERGVRTLRSAFGPVLRRGAGSLEELQGLLDQEARRLMERLTCPVTGTAVLEAWQAERRTLQPLPTMAEPFDVVVSRRVSPDCLISFEGRRYSVPFAWVGRHVEVWGTLKHVVIRGGGREVARHARHSRARLLIDPAHYEGASTERVERPTPLGRRARLQVAGMRSAARRALLDAPPRAEITRPLEAYARLVEVLR
ncbi:MAG: IS21 family transposase [Alphaproteobacteria bacterium]|nr:MAG: IS21 family transposase [Alphaproteobacteria bacterium]